MSSVPRRLTAEEYPARLRQLQTPPADVYLAGHLPAEPGVGIVGTRVPTPEAFAFAHDLASELARNRVTVYSGGATGIDTAAHRGALDAGGPTVVVAPSSFDRPFPKENAELFAEIVEKGGGFLSIYPPGTAANRHRFFGRNRVLAALVDVVVVVETRVRGGARNTAKAARSLDRSLLVVPGGPWNPKAAGCLLEIRNGATMMTSCRDVLDALGLPPGSSGPASRARPPIRSPGQLSLEDFRRGVDPERDSVVAALENGPIDPDRLCALTGLEAHRVQATLLTLTLEGIVVSDPSGRVALLIR